MNVRPNPNPVTQLVFLRDSDVFQNDSWLWPMWGGRWGGNGYFSRISALLQLVPVLLNKGIVMFSSDGEHY